MEKPRDDHDQAVVPAKELGDGEETAFSNAPRSKKYIATAAVYYCTFAFGVGGGVTLMGSSINDFNSKFHADIDETSTIFTISTVAYLIGALSIGILTRFLNRQLIVLALLCIGATAVFILPHVTSLKVFFTLGAFLGLFGGGYDTAQVAWVIDIWRHEAPPFILTQHFFYSLGTIVPPLMLSPFLQSNTTSSTTATPGPSGSSTELSTITPEEEETRLWIPFSIAGLVLSLGIIIQIAFYFMFKSSKENFEKSAIPAINSNSNPAPAKFKFPETREIILVTLSCCCMGSYQGMEICTMQFLPTFTKYSKVALSESEGADVLFYLTVAYCVCRLIGIFIVLKAPPQYILLGNFTLLIAGNLILFFLGGDSVTWLWVGAVVLGAAFSTTFPAYFAYIEKYLFISDTVASIILVMGGGISAIYPIIVGRSVETNPNVLIYVNFFSVSLLMTAFATTFWLTYFKGRKGKESHSDSGDDTDVSLAASSNSNNNNYNSIEKL